MRVAFGVLLGGLILCTAAQAAAPRKLILYVGDGFGPNTLSLAYLYRHHSGEKPGAGPLAMETMMREGHMGLVQPIPDIGELVIESAGAATTLASGVRVTNDQIGVSSQGTPVTSISEEAHAAGLSVGILTTVNIVHATPAAFFGHAASRSNEMELAEQLVASPFAVFLGGGARSFLPETITSGAALGLAKTAGGEQQGARKDGKNLIDEARARGFTVVSKAADLAQAANEPPQRLLGLFAHDHGPMAMDREAKGLEDIPSLAEEVRAALAVLDRDPDGFFLMVEGGKIDFAGHRNDAAGVLWETLEFDEAIGVGLDFARRDGQTLVLVTADHETGGMGFSYQDVPPGDAPAPFAVQIPGRDIRKLFPTVANLRRLASQKASFETIVEEMGPEPGPETVREVVRRYTEVELSDEEAALVAAGKSWAPFFSTSVARGWQRSVLLGLVLSDDYGVSWSTKNHTTIPVLLLGYGPGAERCSGFMENTSVHGILRQVLEGREPGAPPGVETPTP